MKGTGGAGKAIVMGILERHGEVRAKVIPNVTSETLQGEIREHVAQGAEVHTDSWRGYFGLSPDYVHEVINHAEAYVKDNVTTNRIENFWSLLKRGLNGTYISVMPFHLFRYVDEQAFRYNNRKFNDQERFLMACNKMSGRRLTYRKLIGKTLMRDEAITETGFSDTLSRYKDEA
ncbi:MAG TPA: IS1595 family transposase [Blastocatellia bacterium]